MRRQRSDRPMCGGRGRSQGEGEKAGEQGDLDGAIAHYREALRIKPSYALLILHFYYMFYFVSLKSELLLKITCSDIQIR